MFSIFKFTMNSLSTKQGNHIATFSLQEIFLITLSVSFKQPVWPQSQACKCSSDPLLEKSQKLFSWSQKHSCFHSLGPKGYKLTKKKHYLSLAYLFHTSI
jgi:hypothetical protein